VHNEEQEKEQKRRAVKGEVILYLLKASQPWHKTKEGLETTSVYCLGRDEGSVEVEVEVVEDAAEDSESLGMTERPERSW